MPLRPVGQKNAKRAYNWKRREQGRPYRPPAIDCEGGPVQAGSATLVGSRSQESEYIAFCTSCSLCSNLGVLVARLVVHESVTVFTGGLAKRFSPLSFPEVFPLLRFLDRVIFFQL